MKVRKTSIIRIFFILLTFIPIITFSQVEKYATGEKGMIASAHPLASQAGIEMLNKGGNAVDAAVATAFAIGVVEPDGSGIGGGGAMIIYMKDNDKSYYINYYAQGGEKLESISFHSKKDRHTGKSILIPGTVAGLVMAHKEFGKLPFKDVIQPAIKHAEEGFELDQTLATIVLDNTETISADPVTAALYLDDGFPKMEGDLVVQKDLAKTLRIIAEKGEKGFYEGEVAKKMVEGIKKRGGVLTEKDFASYKAEMSEPVKGTYRGYEVYSAGAPQSGLTLIEGLNMLENYDFKKEGHYTESAKTAHVVAETERRIYADRFSHIADPDFISVPNRGLVSKEFARNRFNDINMFKPTPAVYRDTKSANPAKYENSSDSDFVEKKNAGFGDEEDEGKFKNNSLGEDIFDSWGQTSKPRRVKRKRSKVKEKEYEHKDDDIEFDGGGHTTHLSVIDSEGNAVSLTQTLGTFFGSAQTVEGVLFNCARTNYSSTASAINYIKNNKQPRSSITPTIISKDGKPFLIIGTPGGSRIITTVLETIINVIDFDMGVEEANDIARIYCQKYVDYLHVESGVKPEVIKKLERMGHKVQIHDGIDLFFGGVQMIKVDPDTGIFHGSADKRRGGSVIGF